RRISDTLRSAIQGEAPAAVASESRDGAWQLRLNQATLSFASAARTSTSPWSNWTAPAIDVVAHTSVNVRIPTNRYEYEGRSHSLWYCDAKEAGQYSWFETSFMTGAFSGMRGRQNPFALDPGEESAKALWNGMAEYQLAWPFTRLDVDDLDEFV